MKHSVTKFSVISSVQYTLSFITSFFEEMFSQSIRIFYENNMILWYYQIRKKSGLESAWIDGYDSQNKDKNVMIKKNKSLQFFPCRVS